MIELDHLAVACLSLEEGRAYVEDALGITLQPGGKHKHFGTHNLLLALEEGLYLEVIAIDPEAPNPDYPRWFDLDRFKGAPRVSNWICRTNAMSRVLHSHPEAGSPVALERGDLRWQMAVPEHGILPYDGAFPALIEWQGEAHPSQRLVPTGCRLDRLIVRHPDAAQLGSDLALVLDDSRVSFETGELELRAEIMTPRGLRILT